MESVLLETPREALEMIFRLKNDEKALIVKTLSGVPIMMKYRVNKTPINNIYKCLKDKIKYALYDGGEYKTAGDFILRYKKKLRDNFTR